MYNVSRENFAFVIEKKANNQEEIYHLPIEEALSLARASDNLVFIYYGKYRYHYCNGEPLLSIIEYGDSVLSNIHKSSGE